MVQVPAETKNGNHAWELGPLRNDQRLQKPENCLDMYASAVFVSCNAKRHYQLVGPDKSKEKMKQVFTQI